MKALQEFSVTDEITVFSPDQDQNIGSGWSGDTLGKPDPQRPGWPETGTYVLMVTPPPSWQPPPQRSPLIGPPPRRSAPPRDAVVPARRPAPPVNELIANGRHKVSARRTAGITYTDHGFQEYGTSKGQTIPERAEEFLADYLEVDPAELPVHADEILKIAFAGDDDFRQRVRQFFAAQRIRYARVVQALIARKYFTPENAPQLLIRPWISDQRNTVRTGLPDVKALTGNQ